MKVSIEVPHGYESISCVSLERENYDPGITRRVNGKVVEEADIVRDYAHSLHAELRARYVPATIRMTASYKFSENAVAELVRWGERGKCDMLITLHCNFSHDPEERGFEVLHNPAARELAEKASNALANTLQIPRHGDLQCAWRHGMESFSGQTLLINLGYISNDADAEALTRTGMRYAFALALADCLVPSEAVVDDDLAERVLAAYETLTELAESHFDNYTVKWPLDNLMSQRVVALHLARARALRKARDSE